MKKFKTFLITALFICFVKGINAQTLSLPLWETTPPFTRSLLEKDQLEGSGIEKVASPQLLVYLPEKALTNGAAILICPGGGYTKLAIEHEGHEVAEWYRQRGYVAAILKYRLPDEELVEESWKVPLTDAEQGIRLMRHKAAEWQVNQHKVGVLGFSAGGHLAASLSVHGRPASNDLPASRPDFSILIYPVISMDTTITHAGSRNNLLGGKLQTQWEDYYSTEKQVNAQTPPAFIVHSWDDKGVVPQNSIRYAEALQQHQVPLELHLFQKGGHGYGMGNRDNTGNAPSWPELSHSWIQEILEGVKF